MGTARKRCWVADWVIDLDIKAFFDSLDHDLVERAVAHHTDLPWVRLYIARWLRAPVQRPDGTMEPADEGHAAGRSHQSVAGQSCSCITRSIMWMQRKYPSVQFERYADDAIVHCRSERQAEEVLEAIRDRFVAVRSGASSHEDRIVYCKDDDRRGEHEHVSFDFLGYTFQPRRAKNRRGKFFVSFLPAISTRAAKAIRDHHPRVAIGVHQEQSAPGRLGAARQSGRCAAG